MIQIQIIYSHSFYLGDAVLQSFSYGKDTVGSAVIGLAVVSCGYLLLSYMFLVIGRVRYVPMGHVGSMVEKIEKKSPTGMTLTEVAAKSEEKN